MNDQIPNSVRAQILAEEIDAATVRFNERVANEQKKSAADREADALESELATVMETMKANSPTSKAYEQAEARFDKIYARLQELGRLKPDVGQMDFQRIRHVDGGTFLS